MRAGLVRLAGRRRTNRGVDGVIGRPVPRLPQPDPLSATPLTVLLVEDNPGDARLVHEALLASGEAFFEVTHVRTMAAALDALAGRPFDAVLLDLCLPDSLSLVSLGRVREAAPVVPVVVLTGDTNPAQADLALEQGAQDFLVKGEFSGHSVVRAVRYAISRMKTQQVFHSLMAMLEFERFKMAQEIEAARNMQFALLPRPDRVNPLLLRAGLAIESYFEPSSGIGGDLWGCFDCGLRRLGIFAFDFSGHGVQAALNAFRLHALISDHGHLHGDPGALLTEVNAALKPLLPHGQYATIFYGIIDAEADELVWAAGGWPQPVLMAGDLVELLDTKGLPLGIAGTTCYDNRRTPFPPGTELMVYSDAVSEKGDGAGGLVGMAGVRKLVDAARGQGGPRLQSLLDAFLALPGDDPDDDLTLLWLRRQRDGGQ